MSTYSFSFENNRIVCKYNGKVLQIETNGIEKPDLINRFYADIYKDFVFSMDVNTVRNKMNECFKPDVIDTNFKGKDRLDYIYEKNWPGWKNGNKTPIQERTTFYPPLLRLTTDDSIPDTRISYASTIFPESGASPESLSINPEKITKIITPATILDTAGTSYEDKTPFPNNTNMTIIFDELFCEALGFPKGTSWSTAMEAKAHIPEYRVKIQYPTSPSVSNINDIVRPISTKDADSIQKRFGDFKYFSKGNEEKNRELAQSNDIGRNMKILMTKEFGDVAQVFMYLAYIIINQISDRTDLVMITTDNVVLYLCAVLNISCISTANGPGHKSGFCQPVQYLAGPVNYPRKYGGLIRAEKESIEKHNNDQISLFKQIMDRDFTQVAYLIKPREKKIPGRLQEDNQEYIKPSLFTTQDTQIKKSSPQYQQLVELFTNQIQMIEDSNVKLNEEYTKIPESFIESLKNDIDGTKLQQNIRDKIQPYKYKPLFASQIVLGNTAGSAPTVKYILHPGVTIMTEYMKIISVSFDENTYIVNYNEFIEENKQRLVKLRETKDLFNPAKQEKKRKELKKIKDRTEKMRLILEKRQQKELAKLEKEQQKARIEKGKQKTKKERSKQVAIRRGIIPASNKPVSSSRKTVSRRGRPLSKKGGDISSSLNESVGYYECLILVVLYTIGIDDLISLPILYDMIVSRMSTTKGFNEIFHEIFGGEKQDYVGIVSEGYSNEEITEIGLELSSIFFLKSTNKPRSHAVQTTKPKQHISPTSVAHSPSSL